jgi:hypothetical protein
LNGAKIGTFARDLDTSARRIAEVPISQPR